MTATHASSVLNKFIQSQRDRIITYLRHHYSISKDDCEDIFQDSTLILYHNAQDGKLDYLSASLSTYFMSICRNKALELLRRNGKYVHSQDYAIEMLSDPFIENKVNRILSFDDNQSFIEQKEALVRDIVKDLPSPCNELLWGFYRDGLSMKELAMRLGYSNENTAKVTKHRCCEKFKKRFSEMLDKII